ncbi:MAG: pyridoxal 5'-phosphate synthase glutaminase subunit PdxT [Treponema sp.]|nr:pyridoxal 5'-phosphate synthase glutaminase subunit PdxT [Treponema sp.]MBR4629876.1 pyridoxal 5'-phosphate synthase glutaminase subunit PdxT [Treponema sp.]MBR6912975.1 pyridoxal 5'-phosphate synthase glutaminase subunit PdxT [Treponema sp.]
MTAVLAVQGDFREHENMLGSLGEPFFEIRNMDDAKRKFDRLVLPGGESTVQRKLLDELGIKEILRSKINSGIPVLATCAGLILLADFFKTLPVTVRRNAYGRQTGSFSTTDDFFGLGKIPMTFIRAPCIESVRNDVDVKSETDKRITGVQFGKQIGIAFHPELDGDKALYKYFLSL